MNTFVVLIRGINVGGNNKIPMAALRSCLEKHGFTQVTTYIQSGNVLLQSKLTARALTKKLEALLAKEFGLTQPNGKIVVLTPAQLRTVVDQKPKGFGEQPTKYYSDVIFLIGITPTDALPVFRPREGVDTIWPGQHVIYSQRLGAERTKSRLGQIVGTPVYASMTIRSWNTVTKLLTLLKKIDA